MDKFDEDFSMSEAEVEELRADCILTEVSLIESWLRGKLDRVRYYSEPMTEEEILFLIGETERIRRDLRG
jgi:hypothetical protein